jgi:polar amino acid transport system substrate-binding protein/glutamate/aspartate transport system substrate-binding protein
VRAHPFGPFARRRPGSAAANLRRLLAAACLTVLAQAAAQAGVLDKMRASGVLQIGVRLDAKPFSYRNELGEPAGYSVDLCKEVAVDIKKELEIPDLRLEYVFVDAGYRLDAVAASRFDLLCEATTMTLSRRKYVDFSLPIFVTGAGILLRRDGPKDFRELSDHDVGVRQDTTTSAALTALLRKLNPSVRIVPQVDHAEAIEKVISGEISAYFADRAILASLMGSASQPGMLYLSKLQWTYEPYALALPRGDEDFRLSVDRALAGIYRSGRIEEIYRHTFGEAAPGDVLQALYALNSLPE